MTSYTTSYEYGPIQLDESWPEGSTRLDCLSYTIFCRRWIDKFPKLMIKSKVLDVCDACYIFCNYYKIIEKGKYEISDDLMNDSSIRLL